jgi:uncharacterized protein (TIGR02246 family)
MNRELAIVVGLLLAIGNGRAQPAPSTDTAGVTAATAAWVEAFNSRDPKRIVALYAADAVFWGTTAKAIATTPEAVWAYFKDAGQRPSVRVTIDEEHPRALGTIAINSGSYTFSDVRDGVANNVRPARFTFVFRRDGDRWLIVEHHSSRVPDP